MEKELSLLYLPNEMKHEINATTNAIRNSQLAFLVLAYGNPLRRDDGVGWVIGERLAGTLAATLTEDVADVRVLHQLTPELAEPISRAERVIFVDAAEGERPGAIHWAAIQPGNFAAQPFTHQVDPASLLAAAKELFGHAPPTHLLTVTGTDFGFGEGLSPAVERAVEEAVGRIGRMIESRY